VVTIVAVAGGLEVDRVGSDPEQSTSKEDGQLLYWSEATWWAVNYI